ncbi:MAG: triose-phosphate isomerase [Nitrososphaerales archaeon]
MQTPVLIINEKNYLEVSGDGALKLARAAEAVASELGVEVAVAPPLPSLGLVAGAVSIPVLAQHTDAAKAGSSTGSIVPELVKSLGAVGSLVNHSEKRVPFEVLKLTVLRLKEAGLVSVVCAKTPEEVSRIAAVGPDFIAIEPPELIGSGIAVSKAKPEVVSDSVEAARRVDPKVRVICGAGIVAGEDVDAALRLGSVGVLVASGIVKASDWRTKIIELVEPLRG